MSILFSDVYNESASVSSDYRLMKNRILRSHIFSIQWGNSNNKREKEELET